MKCEICKKEVSLTPEIIKGEPQWFGRYIGQKLVQIICNVCIKNVESKKKYSSNSLTE